MAVGEKEGPVGQDVIAVAFARIPSVLSIGMRRACLDMTLALALTMALFCYGLAEAQDTDGRSLTLRTRNKRRK